MALQEPLAAYDADSNLEALLVQRFLENEGIEAFVTEDHSLGGYAQVWINRCDAECVARFLRDYERRKIWRAVDRMPDDDRVIEVHCEDCGKTSTFGGSRAGTVQDCPHCGSYIDVGEFEWPHDASGVGDDDGEAGR